MVADASVDPVASVCMNSIFLNLEASKMKATRFFETSASIYPATQLHIPEDRNPIKNALRLSLVLRVFVLRLFSLTTLKEFTPFLNLRTFMFSFNAIWLTAFFNVNPLFLMGISFFMGYAFSYLRPLYQESN